MKLHRIAAFTDRGRGGNPAGVTLVDMLPEPAEMQRIAAEVGYSETAFAAPASNGFVVRYYSPTMEVAFCGHATIALGAVLATEYGAGSYPLHLANTDIEVEGTTRGGEAYAILRSPPTRQRTVPPSHREAMLTLFGYTEENLDPAIPMMYTNAGADHLIIPLARRDDLARMDYDFESGRALMRERGLTTVAFVVRQEPQLFHARNAFAAGGVFEDAATGAAAAAFTGMLRDQGLLDGGKLTIIQGEDMGQRSRIDVEYSLAVGTSVLVGGAASVINDFSVVGSD